MEDQEVLEAARRWFSPHGNFGDTLVLREVERCYEGGLEGFKQDLILGNMS